jgi:hypothetical protein
MNYVLVILALFIAGCGSGRSTNYMIYNIKPEYSEVLEARLKKIEDKASDNFFHYPKGQADFSITVEFGQLQPGYWGIAYSGENCKIVLSNVFLPNLYKDAMGITFLHEIGHCYGLDHSPNRHDIMFYSAGSPEHYLEAAWERFYNQLMEIRR